MSFSYFSYFSHFTEDQWKNSLLTNARLFRLVFGNHGSFPKGLSVPLSLVLTYFVS